MKTVGQNLIKAQWEIAHQSIDSYANLASNFCFHHNNAKFLVSSLCHILISPIHANENENWHTNAPKMAQKSREKNIIHLQPVLIDLPPGKVGGQSCRENQSLTSHWLHIEFAVFWIAYY